MMKLQVVWPSIRGNYRLELADSFKWKDEPGHRKLARTIAKIKDGSYQSFEKANSQPLNILKEFVRENASLSL